MLSSSPQDGLTEPGQDKPAPLFQITIAYQDADIGAQAMGTFDVLARNLNGAFLVRGNLWSFKVLELESLRKSAAEEAGRASMIIIACREAVELPAVVRSWVEQWTETRQHDPGLLVAIVEGDPPPGTAGVRAYLEVLSHRTGMDFFSRIVPSQFESEDSAVRLLNRRAAESSSVLDSILLQHLPTYDRWGINE